MLEQLIVGQAHEGHEHHVQRACGRGRVKGRYGWVDDFDVILTDIAMGRAAGYNMAAKKMVNFSFIPWCQSRVFDLLFDFIGDFTKTPTRVELEGDRDKKRKFMLKCYQLNKLTGVVFCNADEKKVQAVRVDFAKMR